MIRTIFLVTVLFTVLSCEKDKVAVSVVCEDEISYQNDIQPLLQMNCAVIGCHVPPSPTGGYDWTSLAVVQTNSELMLQAMRHSPGVTPMPYLAGVKIADSLINKFECWVVQGSLDN
tara:strand:- start:28227 stop:28577 length:351 start_codon:yes stop_codon:yes gene_type:complete